MLELRLKNGKVPKGSLAEYAGSERIIGTQEEAECPCCDTWGCTLNLQYVDINGCEDDAFNVYIVNPEDGTERFLFLIDMVSSPAGCCGFTDSGKSCPKTTINKEVTIERSDIDACCNFILRLELDHLNCCATYAVFTMIGPGGTVDSQAFSGDTTLKFNVAEVCGGGGPP
jgi:hypothetical protein